MVAKLLYETGACTYLTRYLLCGERKRCAQRSVKEKIDILVEESLDKQINTNYYNFFFNWLKNFKKEN